MANSEGRAAEIFFDEARAAFRAIERQGRQVLEQLGDEDVTWTPDPESNSIATIVKHVAGNARSRWTDFLTTDGEKPDRNRDGEFEDPPRTVAEVRKLWDDGWAIARGALDALTPEDLAKEVTIRGEPLSVVAAIVRAISHYAGHAGQMVWIGKHRKGEAWRTLSIPRRRS